jgi:predicted Rossmann-fold nucleotide-binding protein
LVDGGQQRVKREIDSPAALDEWLASPTPAVFQGLDLRQHDEAITARLVAHCTFIGCMLGPLTFDAAQRVPTVVIPVIAELPFDGFRAALYAPDELYDVVDANGALVPSQCYDRLVYESYADERRVARAVSLDVTVMRRLHDAAMHDALDEFLTAHRRTRSVAIMGGHDEGRDSALFRAVVELGVAFTNAGFTVLTGGGPGLMEAANLGAYCAGFNVPGEAIDTVLRQITIAPRYDHPQWLTTAWEARRSLGPPARPAGCESVGIPTWFYGHEPPNVWATHIAKFFDNSVREDGLLAFAHGGIVFAPGRGGTVQEVFQDACQNYYATFGAVSPMVLLDRAYWTRDKPAWQLLQALAREAGFTDMISITDHPAEALEFIQQHPPRLRPQ